MSKFKRKSGKESPAISTASLPDIVFMLLFFFMVTTVMRDSDLMVKNKVPQATQISKLENKSLVSYIFVGSPIAKFAEQYGTAPRIQLNDKFATKEQIAEFVESERSKKDEAEIPLLTFSIKSDIDVKMGIISDIKEELRQVQALKINYSATQKADQK